MFYYISVRALYSILTCIENYDVSLLKICKQYEKNFNYEYFYIVGSFRLKEYARVPPSITRGI